MKANLFYRITCLCLAAVLTLGAFVGCGTKTPSNTGSDSVSSNSSNSSSTSDSIANNASTTSDEPLVPIKFTVFSGGTDPGKFDEDPVHKFIREDLGVDIQPIYTANENATQINLWLAAGDYPDAISMKPGVEIDAFVEGDHALDLTAWWEKYLPRYYEQHLQYPNRFTMNNIAGHENKLWYVPQQLGVDGYPGIAPAMAIRFDLWQKYMDETGDTSKPKDLEEYYQLVKKLQAANPESEGKKVWGFSGWGGSGWFFRWWMYATTAYAGSNDWNYTAVESEDYALEYGFDSDLWMWTIRFMNRAYREGVADPEMVTMSQEDWNKKLAQGLVVSTPESAEWMIGPANAARAAAGHPEQKIYPYTWMTYPAVGFPDRGTFGGVDINGIVNLIFTKNCKDAEEIFKRLSWLATEEGQAVQGMGLEGVHWDYDADGFRKPRQEIIDGYLNDVDFRHKTGVDRWNIFCDVFTGCDSKGDAFRIDENKYIIALQEDEYDTAYKNFMNLDMNLSIRANAARAGVMDTKSEWRVTPQIPDDTNEIGNQIFNMLEEYMGKLILAKNDAEFDALIAEWKNKCEKVNYMEYFNFVNPIYTSAYREYKAQVND